jgi:hypothetical protein
MPWFDLTNQPSDRLKKKRRIKPLIRGYNACTPLLSTGCFQNFRPLWALPKPTAGPLI